MQVMLTIEQTGQYKRSIEAVFYKNFLDADNEYNIEFERQVNFFTYSSLRDHLLQSRENYFKMFENSTDSFDRFSPYNPL